MAGTRRWGWLALAAAACSVDSRNVGLPDQTLVQIPPAEPNGTGNPPTRTDPNASATTPGAAGSGSEQSGSGAPPLDPSRAAAPGEGSSSAEPSAPSTGCGSVGFDTLFQQAQADLLTQPVDDRASLRYISFTNRVGAGSCGAALDEDRNALVKALNMLSLSTSIQVPVAIDEGRTLYRIELRHYFWNRAIQVQGRNFNDVWEAIADRDPYAVAFQGPDADALTSGTQTATPILFADQLLDTAMTGPLYHAIIGVDVGESLDDFVLGVHLIDLQANLQAGRSLRAGSTQPGVTGQEPHIVQRDEMLIQRGALWQSFELGDTSNGFELQDLLGMPAQRGGEAIFTLPNGMLGFLVFNTAGVIVASSDVLLDTDQSDLRMRSAVSCSGCHAHGLLPVTDEAGPFLLANALSLGADRDQVAQAQALYVTPEEFARVATADSEGFLQVALLSAGLPTSGEDPVARVFQRFNRDLLLADAAGDLGLPAETLQARLLELHPVHSVLGTGALDRDEFAIRFVDSLCLLSSSNTNRPDPAACAAARP